MKKILSLFGALLYCISSFAQITNPILNAGFEDSNFSDFDYWWTYPQFHTRVTTAHEGSFAINSHFYQYPEYPQINLSFPIQTRSSQSNTYLPISSRPTQLVGWGILYPGGDILSFNVSLKKSGLVIGTGQMTTAATYTQYTQFVIDINFASAATPDSFSLSFDFTSRTNKYATFTLDDLSFDYVTGINKDKLIDATVIAFPSPTQNTTTFFNSASQTNRIEKIELFDVAGKLFISKEFKFDEVIQIGLSDFKNGLYFAKIMFENGQTLVKKIIKE